MKRLTCEMCGSTNLVKKDGLFECQDCGTKYSVEEARKMMVEGTVDVTGSTVKVDNTGMISSYLQMAENALASNNGEEAETYANKIIEIDPQSYMAWYIKGNAAGWQTTGRNNRFPESIVNWINAYQFAPEDKKEELSGKISDEAKRISTAILQMKANSFTGFRSEDNKNGVTNALNMIEKQFGTLEEKTDIDVYTASFKTVLARVVNSGAVDASNASDREFGTERRSKSRFSWNKYTGDQDRCLSLLSRAYDLSSDDDLCEAICKNYINIARTTRDSCSYTYQNGSYVVEYTFTDQAKTNRTNEIDRWQKKLNKHGSGTRNSNCKRAKESLAKSRGDEERQLAIAQYWEAHSAEKAALESEKADLDAKLEKLQSERDSNSDRIEVERLEKEIDSTKSQMNSLGLFKGKEKKALQSKIDELSSSKSNYSSKWREVEKRIDSDRREANKRIREINEEFTKDRGIPKMTSVRSLALFENGQYVPTVVELLEYNRAVMPQNITIKGDGKEAIENYSKTLMLEAQSLMKAFGSLLVGTTLENDKSFEYTDDPNKKKTFRINFLVNNQKSDAFLNCEAKTVESVIEGEYYYCLEKDKTPEKVANFTSIVTYSILGICPSVDMNALQTAIIETAYGIAPETTFNADGIVITVEGGTKVDTKVVLKSGIIEN